MAFVTTTTMTAGYQLALRWSADETLVGRVNLVLTILMVASVVVILGSSAWRWASPRR